MFTNTNVDFHRAANSRVPLLFEIIPPEKGKQEKRLQQHTEHLNYLYNETDFDAFNLPEIHDKSQKGENGNRRKEHKERISPRSYVGKLSGKFEAEYIINRVVVKQPHKVQEKWLLDTYHKFGIKNLVLVGGESSKIDYPGPSVPETNRLIKNYLNKGEHKYAERKIESTDFTIGNICIPTRRNNDFDEPERMLKKVQAGADFFTSQIITEAQTPVSLLKDFSALNDREECTPPLICWSFSPIAEKKDVDFLRWLGVHIPEQVEEMILGSDDPVAASVDWAEDVWQQIMELNSQLAQPLPMGINISVMGLRNFKNGVRVAKRLLKTETLMPEKEQAYSLDVN